jgi:ABC-type transporter Mla subunit MlaD
MNSPASLATAVLDRLEDDLPSVRAWLAELAAAADLDREAAALVAGLEADLNRVVRNAAALATACGERPA